MVQLSCWFRIAELSSSKYCLSWSIHTRFWPYCLDKMKQIIINVINQLSNGAIPVGSVFNYLPSSRWNPDASELTLSWTSKLSKVKLALTCLTSSYVHTEPVYEGTPTEGCLLTSGNEMLEQTSWIFSLAILSIYIFKNSWAVDGRKSSLQHFFP